MNTRQLYYLVTIADKHNLSAAAQALSVSQSALSRFLAKRESELGFLLFMRHHKELIPTVVGRYVLQFAQKILDEQNRMLTSIRDVSGGNITRIRLATAPNRGAIIYSRIYNEFSRRYPGIALQLTELYASEQATAINRGQIDLALGSGEISNKVTDVPIAHEMLLISLPASHPLSGRESIRVKDLRDTPFVLQGPKHSIRIIAEKLFAEAGFSPVVVFESNDVILIDSMMHQAVGAGFVSKAHVFPCDELVYLPLDPPVYQTLHIRYPLEHTLTEPERYLAGLLVRERLTDPRYSPIHTPEAEALYAAALSGEEPVNAGEKAAKRSSGRQQAISLDTKVMEYLIAIVEEEGLERAAQRFYLSQPALSRHLRNVERTVGTPLFTREHNRLRPTSAGAIFVNNARNILRMEAEMERHIEKYRKGHAGGISLQYDSSLGAVLDGPLQERFAQLHPGMQIHLVPQASDSPEEALLNASVDLSLFFSNTAKHPMLSCQTVAQWELFYCFDREAPPETVPMQLPLCGEMASRPLMLASAGDALRLQQERLISLLWGGRRPPVVCEARPRLLLRLMRSGGGDTILPGYLLSQGEPFPVCPFTPAQPLYLLLARNTSRTLPSPVEDLAALLTQMLSRIFEAGTFPELV